MEKLIERIQARLADNLYPNEAAVSLGIVIPILRALGWDDTDPVQIIPEYASGGRRVDFALFGPAKSPVFFIEVKGVGRSDEGDKQLFEYAFHEGIPLCLLTDGNGWSFYLPGGQGSYDERRVYRLQLNERPAAECVRILHRYLAHARVRSGEAFEDALRDYRDNSARREATRSIPEAWRQLVAEPEDLLVDLLSEQTETVSGYRPTSAKVTKFLRSLTIASGGRGEVTPRRGTQSEKTAERIGGESAGRGRSTNVRSSRAVEYELFGMKQTARDASTALVEILTAIAADHPEKMEAVAEAVRGRSRNHIARTVAEIYPARPDLARAAEFAPGWLVGLNIANREKMRIIRATCEVTGLKFGRDVIIDLPNANA